jgi:four helix bundle protein
MWQRAQELTDLLLDVVATLPSSRVSSVVAQQIIRSSSSIAANIAEGHGRLAPGAYRNHLSIARGSTTETISWIDLLARRRLMTGNVERQALGLCAELMKMITAKMNAIDRTPADRGARHT